MHYAFQDSNNVFIIMEYLSGGDLRYQTIYNKTFTEQQTSN